MHTLPGETCPMHGGAWYETLLWAVSTGRLGHREDKLWSQVDVVCITSWSHSRLQPGAFLRAYIFTSTSISVSSRYLQDIYRVALRVASLVLKR